MTEEHWTGLVLHAGRIAEQQGWTDAVVVEAPALKDEGPQGTPLLVIALETLKLEQAREVAGLVGAGRNVAVVSLEPPAVAVAEWLPNSVITSGPWSSSDPAQGGAKRAAPLDLMREAIDDYGFAGLTPLLTAEGLEVVSVSLEADLPYDQPVIPKLKAQLRLDGHAADLWLVFGLYNGKYWGDIPALSPPDPEAPSDFRILDDESSALVPVRPWDGPISFLAPAATSSLPPRWRRFLDAGGSDLLWFLAHGLSRLTTRSGESAVNVWLPEISQGLDSLFSRS